MTLATHIIIAAAVTKPLVELYPAVIFASALASHYLSDAIPHWDYKILSFKDKNPEDVHKRKWPFRSRTFWLDILRINVDFVIGLLVLFLIVRPGNPDEWLIYLLVASGGVLPDFLQGVYFTRKADFLRPIHIFHDWIHTKIKLGQYPLIGVPFQILIFSITLWFLI
jgi:hypothetical protein